MPALAAQDRVTLIWPNRAIEKQWLQITVHANANTGLPIADVHYWGNYVGETGNALGSAAVDLLDRNGVRDNQNNFLTLAEITNPYDLDRDRWVDLVDRNLVRDNQSNFLNELRMITVPAASPMLEGHIGVLSSGAALYSVRADSWATTSQANSIEPSPLEAVATSDASHARRRWEGMPLDIPLSWLNVTRGKRAFRVEPQGQTRQDPGYEYAVDYLLGDLKPQESCYTRWVFCWS